MLLHLEDCKSNANPIQSGVQGRLPRVSMVTARYNVMVETELKLGQATVTWLITQKSGVF